MKEISIREKSTAWKEVLSSFFTSDSKQTKKEEQDFLQWEKENKLDLSDSNKTLANLETMISQHTHENKKSNKAKKLGKISSKSENIVKVENDIARKPKVKNMDQENEIGE